MFTLLLFGAIGAYLSKRVHVFKEAGIGSATVDYAAIAADLVALFAFLSGVGSWFIAVGRQSRNYFNLAIAPWLERRGVSVSLPTLDLPRLPATDA